MANRYLKGRTYSYETDLVRVMGSMVVGATGAVGTVKGAGISSISRTGTGAYTITLNDNFNFLWEFDATFMGGTASGIGGVELSDTLANIKANIRAKTVKIQCYSSGSTAADPANGTVMLFTMLLRNSNLGLADYV